LAERKVVWDNGGCQDIIRLSIFDGRVCCQLLDRLLDIHTLLQLEHVDLIYSCLPGQLRISGWLWIQLPCGSNISSRLDLVSYGGAGRTERQG
jgi:hypothetical protein